MGKNHKSRRKFQRFRIAKPKDNNFMQEKRMSMNLHNGDFLTVSQRVGNLKENASTKAWSERQTVSTVGSGLVA